MIIYIYIHVAILHFRYSSSTLRQQCCFHPFSVSTSLSLLQTLVMQVVGSQTSRGEHMSSSCWSLHWSLPVAWVPLKALHLHVPWAWKNPALIGSHLRCHSKVIRWVRKLKKVPLRHRVGSASWCPPGAKAHQSIQPQLICAMVPCRELSRPIWQHAISAWVPNSCESSSWTFKANRVRKNEFKKKKNEVSNPSEEMCRVDTVHCCTSVAMSCSCCSISASNSFQLMTVPTNLGTPNLHAIFFQGIFVIVFCCSCWCHWATV